MMDQGKRIEGYFLSFTESEFALIHAMLDEEGYGKDIAGLKAFLLDCAQPVEPRQAPHAGATDRVLHTLESFVMENPATVNYLLNAGKQFLKRKARK